MKLLACLLLCSLLGVALVESIENSFRVENPDLNISQRDEKKSSQCEICKWAVLEAELLVATNESTSDILAQITAMCIFFPNPTWRQECKAIIAQDGTQIVNLILSAANPFTICAQLNLCNGTNTESEFLNSKRMLKYLRRRQDSQL
eukprot:TRINITY_DN7587_c0_g1_i1.p1 TRINITY_DN7587_c0_g1~~TRINITY_DN7587_c0_g1_i1.p1  ORF type:complete len:147 (+),score=17.37 TRINITY_DN7587_c0_g1_i1:92-532(+)